MLIHNLAVMLKNKQTKEQTKVFHLSGIRVDGRW
jgi:hypothetical protein